MANPHPYSFLALTTFQSAPSETCPARPAAPGPAPPAVAPAAPSPPPSSPPGSKEEAQLFFEAPKGKQTVAGARRAQGQSKRVCSAWRAPGARDPRSVQAPASSQFYSRWPARGDSKGKVEADAEATDGYDTENASPSSQPTSSWARRSSCSSSRIRDCKSTPSISPHALCPPNYWECACDPAPGDGATLGTSLARWAVLPTVPIAAGVGGDAFYEKTRGGRSRVAISRDSSYSQPATPLPANGMRIWMWSPIEVLSTAPSQR